MPRNLHVLDRIPHETNKGFVQFKSTVQMAKGEKVFNKISYDVRKIEHSYSLEIIRPLLISQSIPISDRSGTSIYSIRFPIKARLLDYNKFIDNAVGTSPVKNVNEAAARNFSTGLANMRYNNKKEIWIDGSGSARDNLQLDTNNQRLVVVFQTRNIEIPIEPGKVTPVNLIFRGSWMTDGDVMQFEGNLLFVTVGEPLPIKVVTKNLIQGTYQGPKTYPTSMTDLFAKAAEAAINIGWEEVSRDSATGQLVFVKKRFPGEPAFYTIGIYALSDHEAGLTISSDGFRQRWGSINANICVEHINAYFAALDDLVSGRLKPAT